MKEHIAAAVSCRAAIPTTTGFSRVAVDGAEA